MWVSVTLNTGVALSPSDLCADVVPFPVPFCAYVAVLRVPASGTLCPCRIFSEFQLLVICANVAAFRVPGYGIHVIPRVRVPRAFWDVSRIVPGPITLLDLQSSRITRSLLLQFCPFFHSLLSIELCLSTLTSAHNSHRLS